MTMRTDYNEDRDRRWYGEQDPESLAESAHKTAMELRAQQRGTLAGDAADRLSLYDPHSVASDEFGMNAAIITPYFEPELPAYNVVQAATDTLVSQLIRNRVRPLFLTDGGDAELQARGEGMTRVVEAGFQESAVWGDLGRQWARDAAVHGTGWLKCMPDYNAGRVIIERCFDWEIYASHADGKRGRPRQIHHVYPIDRSMLLERYPASEDAIMRADAAESADGGQTYGSGLVADQVLVCESWHLPSAPVDHSDEKNWDIKKAKHDGRHTITIGAERDAALLLEAWPFDYFPLVPFKLIGRNLGMRGRGVPETIFGVQLALNRTCKRLDKILNLHGRPIVMVDRGAKINKNLLTNDVALVIETSRQGGLQYIAPNAVSPEFVAQIERLVRWGFEQVGLSQLSAVSQKPAGLESGVAIRTVLDTESLRHSDPFLGWEDAHVQLAKVYIDCVRLLDENSKEGFTAFWGDERELREIRWKAVDLPSTKYRLSRWPTNLFAQTPGAKKDELLEMYRDGILDKDEVLEHLDYPDIRSSRDSLLKARENIDHILMRMVRDKIPHVPHNYLNLQLAKKLGLVTINELELKDRMDSPEAELVRKWLEGIDQLMQQNAPPPTEPPPLIKGPPGPAQTAIPTGPQVAPPPPGMGIAA